MENKEHEAFLKDYNEAIQPICEKHKLELVPVFRFGEQFLPAQLVINEKKEDTSASDKGDKESKE